MVFSQLSLSLTLPVSASCVPQGRTVLWLSLPYVAPSHPVVGSSHSPSCVLKGVQVTAQLSLPHTSPFSFEALGLLTRHTLWDYSCGSPTVTVTLPFHHQARRVLICSEKMRKISLDQVIGVYPCLSSALRVGGFLGSLRAVPCVSKAHCEPNTQVYVCLLLYIPCPPCESWDRKQNEAQLVSSVLIFVALAMLS